MNLTQQEKAELICAVAAEKGMSASIWQKDESEIRVYLMRGNAARTEAGYIRLRMTDGKPVIALVFESIGAGSRTAKFEAESVLAAYQARKKQIAQTV